MLENHEKVKYLLLDHGGVIDTHSFLSENKENIITEDDLVLKDDGMFTQIMQDGVTIIQRLNRLVDECGYKIVFHSKNSLIDQVEILQMLRQACTDKELRCPKIFAMGVCDSAVTRPTTDPLISNIDDDITVFTYGIPDEGDQGKSSLRKAIMTGLGVTPDEYHLHTVFDDGEPNIRQPLAEGFNAYCIKYGEGVTALEGDPLYPYAMSLNAAIEEVFELAINHRRRSVTATEPSRFSESNAYSKLYNTLGDRVQRRLAVLHTLLAKLVLLFEAKAAEYQGLDKPPTHAHSMLATQCEDLTKVFKKFLPSKVSYSAIPSDDKVLELKAALNIMQSFLEMIQRRYSIEDHEIEASLTILQDFLAENFYLNTEEPTEAAVSTADPDLDQNDLENKKVEPQYNCLVC